MQTAKTSTRTSSDNSLLGHVLACLDRGWPVTPLCWPDARGRCACPKRHTKEKEIGKAPLLGIGYQERLLSREEVVRIWTRDPCANYGILLKPSGLFVLDADSLEADRESETLGVPPGPRVRRDDHIHRYFHNQVGIVGRAIHAGTSGKIDILTDGYLAGPGSLHRCGTRYVCEVSFDEVALDAPPRWAIERLRQSSERGDTEEIPADLPLVDIDTLRVSRFIKALIRCGPATDPAKYPSRSEAVFVVLTALLGAGITDTATLASILLDPRYVISEKPREQGSRWVASEIARAKAKLHEDNGGAPWPGDEDAPRAEDPQETSGPTGKSTTEQKTHGSPGTPRVTLRRPAELVAAPISWRVASIIPDNMLTVLHARDKLGKTLLAWDVACAMLKDRAFLGTFTTTPGRVVLALLDDPHDLTVARRDALGLGDCEDLRIVTPLDADLSDPAAFLADFKKACEEFQPALIVIDALYLFLPAGKDAGNDAARMRGPMGVFNSLAETLHAAVLLIAHDRNDGSDVAGSHVIRASAKALLHLTKPKWSSGDEEEDDGRRVLTVVSKMTGEARHLLRCQGAGAWTYIGQGDSAYQARTTWAQDRILTWLKEGGEGIVPDVAKAAKIRNADALAALIALIEEGLAESELQPRADGKRGKGRLVYRLKPNGPASGNGSPKEKDGNDRSDSQKPAQNAAQNDLPIVLPLENQAGTIGQSQKSTINGLFSADQTYRSQNLFLRGKNGNNSFSDPHDPDGFDWETGGQEEDQ